MCKKKKIEDCTPVIMKMSSFIFTVFLEGRNIIMIKHIFMAIYNFAIGGRDNSDHNAIHQATYH